MSQEAIQEIIDEERGYLDQKHGQTCGYSGPATPAYMRGFGTDFAADARGHAASEFRNNYVDHGWH